MSLTSNVDTNAICSSKHTVNLTISKLPQTQTHFVCMFVYLSLMWFLYPRAISEKLTQERKCSYPVHCKSFFLPTISLCSCTLCESECE